MSRRMDPSRIRFTPLSFYEIKKTLIEPTRLSSTNFGAPFVRHNCLFSIPAEYVKLLNEQGTGLPRYELMMRMTVCEESNKQVPDILPLKLSVTINDNKVELPPYIRYVGIETPEQRKSAPIILTEACSRSTEKHPTCSPFQSQKPYNLMIEWKRQSSNSAPWDHNNKDFIFVVWIVQHVTVDMLFDRLVASTQKRHYNETKKMIKKALMSEDEEIEGPETINLKLTCPIAITRIKTPARSKKCAHLECFDLKSFLLMREKREDMRKCPVLNCPVICEYEDLIIDDYFAEILSQTSDSIGTVKLSHEVVWKAVEEKPASSSFRPIKSERLDDANCSTATSSSGSSSSGNKTRSDLDIITIDESDDEVDNSKKSTPPTSKISNGVMEKTEPKQQNGTPARKPEEIFKQQGTSVQQNATPSRVPTTQPTLHQMFKNSTPNSSSGTPKTNGQAKLNVPPGNPLATATASKTATPARVNPTTTASSLTPSTSDPCIRKRQASTSSSSSLNPDKRQKVAVTNASVRTPLVPSLRQGLNQTNGMMNQGKRPTRQDLLKNKTLSKRKWPKFPEYHDFSTVKQKFEDYLNSKDNRIALDGSFDMLRKDLSKTLYKKDGEISREALKLQLERVAKGRGFWFNPSTRHTIQNSIQHESFDGKKLLETLQATYRRDHRGKELLKMDDLEKTIEQISRETTINWESPEINELFLDYHLQTLFVRTLKHNNHPFSVTEAELEFEMRNKLDTLIGFVISDSLYNDKAKKQTSFVESAKRYGNALNFPAFERNMVNM